MPYFLGLDGGGTKTASVILSEDRIELGRGIGGPCNIATTDDATLKASIKSAAETALETASLPESTRFAAACAGVAGYTSKSRRADFQSLFAESIPAETHRVEPDFVIAYWGAAEGKPGIIAIAGTGAAVYGCNAEGDSARADGRGYLLGDQGSGFQMALAAVRSIIQYEQWHEPQPELNKRILEEIGAADGDDVVEWLYRDFSPGKAAGLMKVISDSALMGDDQAQNIIRRAAQRLANRSVRTVARELKMEEGELHVYTSGGIWDATPLYGESFKKAIAGPEAFWNPPPAKLVMDKPAHDPAFGAALLALNSPT